MMSEERRRRKEADEWAPPKRECPVPKPGGLIGQVLGIKEEADDAEDQPSVTRQVDRARWKRRTQDEDQS